MQVNITTAEYRKGREDGMREAAKIAIETAAGMGICDDYREGEVASLYRIAQSIESAINPKPKGDA